MKQLPSIEWVLANSIPVPESGCWLWLGATSKGYGTINVSGKNVRVHRFVYEAMRGPIPPGLFTDHLCRVRCCINPDHMEPVTNKENVLRGIGRTAVNARKKYCKNGHPFDENNTFKVRKGRECHKCRLAAGVEWRLQRKKKKAANV